MEGWREIIDFLDRHSSVGIIVGSLLSGLLSTFIAGMFSYLSSVSRNRSDELRARSDIAVRIGLEAFKHTFAIATKGQGKIELLPPEFWILSSIKLAELLKKKRITAEIAKEAIDDAMKFSHEISKLIKSSE